MKPHFFWGKLEIPRGGASMVPPSGIGAGCGLKISIWLVAYGGLAGGLFMAWKLGQVGGMMGSTWPQLTLFCYGWPAL